MRILIVRTSALGDVVHALPVLSAVRAKFPDAHIAWVVNRAFEPLIAGHPHLTETIPFDRGGLMNPATRAPGAALDATTRQALDRVLKWTDTI